MKMNYKNKDFNTIFIPDPAILINNYNNGDGYQLIKYLIKYCHVVDNDRPHSLIGKINVSMTKLDQFIQHSNTIDCVSFKKVQTATTLVGNFIQNINEHDEIKHIMITVHENIDNMSDYNVNISNQFNIVSHLQAFIGIPLDIIDENNNNNNNDNNGEMYAESFMTDFLHRRYFVLTKEYFYERKAFLTNGLILMITPKIYN